MPTISRHGGVNTHSTHRAMSDASCQDILVNDLKSCPTPGKHIAVDGPAEQFTAPDHLIRPIHPAHAIDCVEFCGPRCNCELANHLNDQNTSAPPISPEAASILYSAMSPPEFYGFEFRYYLPGPSHLAIYRQSRTGYLYVLQSNGAGLLELER